MKEKNKSGVWVGGVGVRLWELQSNFTLDGIIHETYQNSFIISLFQFMFHTESQTQTMAPQSSMLNK